MVNNELKAPISRRPAKFQSQLQYLQIGLIKYELNSPPPLLSLMQKWAMKCKYNHSWAGKHTERERACIKRYDLCIRGAHRVQKHPVVGWWEIKLLGLEFVNKF